MDEKVLKHVVERSKEWGIPLPSNVQDILTNIEDSFQKKAYTFVLQMAVD